MERSFPSTEFTGKNPITVRRILNRLGIEPHRNIYDDRLKLYAPGQLEKVLQIAGQIDYARKATSND